MAESGMHTRKHRYPGARPCTISVTKGAIAPRPSIVEILPLKRSRNVNACQLIHAHFQSNSHRVFTINP